LFLDGNTRTLRLYTPERSESITFAGPRTADETRGHLAGAFVESLRSFVSAICAGDLAAPTSAARTLHVVEVQAAILASGESGRVVELPMG
jgi:hypothetical protein